MTTQPDNENQCRPSGYILGAAVPGYTTSWLGTRHPSSPWRAEGASLGTWRIDGSVVTSPGRCKASLLCCCRLLVTRADLQVFTHAWRQAPQAIYREFSEMSGAPEPR